MRSPLSCVNVLVFAKFFIFINSCLFEGSHDVTLQITNSNIFVGISFFQITNSTL